MKFAGAGEWGRVVTTETFLINTGVSREKLGSCEAQRGRGAVVESKRSRKQTRGVRNVI